MGVVCGWVWGGRGGHLVALSTLETVLMEVSVEHSNMPAADLLTTHMAHRGAQGAQRRPIVENQKLLAWVNRVPTLAATKTG